MTGFLQGVRCKAGRRGEGTPPYGTVCRGGRLCPPGLDNATPCRAGPVCPAVGAGKIWVGPSRTPAPTDGLQEVRRGGALPLPRATARVAPTEGYKRCGEVRNPPVTASPCQPPLGKGAKGAGWTDCHDQFANWSRNDRVYYGRKPPRRGLYGATKIFLRFMQIYTGKTAWDLLYSSL